MKVRQERRLVKVTIELESEKELGCLKYLLFCNIDPSGNSIRKERLGSLGLDYDEDVLIFQHKLDRKIKEEDDC